MIPPNISPFVGCQGTCYERPLMSGRYAFTLKSEERRRPLPGKIIIGQHATETQKHVLLKFIGYLLFFREQIQLEPRLVDDNIPFIPDLIAFDYTLRPTLWVECGECSVAKLDRLAVKVPDAEIWVIKRSVQETEDLWRAMAKAELRTNRYGLVALDPAMFDEMAGLLTQRNELTWFHGSFDPPTLQFEFNGLWFDSDFKVLMF
jgi:uncharacterized protein YaeQ